jgi:CheY-like chemotaxis protein
MARFEQVLLVDDNEIDNFINERIISSSGFSANVTVKFSADAALEYLKEVANDPGRIPDVIFLDLNMPVKDGFGFLEDYNNIDDAVKAKAKVIVLSSSISPDDINRASVNPHVYKYLNKPLSEKYLDSI